MSDTNDRRARIEALFLATCDMASAERAEFLANECGEDTELASAVLRLLEADRRAVDWVGNLARDLNIANVLDSGKARAKADERFGKYRLSELIGSGGMGEVWRAERADGRFEGEVAIKLLGLCPPNSGARLRFEREGRLLARLVHPNIARLFDVGINADDQPFLILELVDGVPIDQFCQLNDLDVRARVHLFLDVLEAIAHAHSNLIVHRDIKPANVLVNQQGEVKLLDFGIASLLDDTDSETKGGNLTELYGAMFTPEFAAPEQLLSQDVTTRTDVYSLGLLLYVLLAGHSPKRSSDEASYTLLEAIRHATDELPKASNRLAAQSTIARKALIGDLDNIIAKAVDPTPANRYGSALALADDLRRYLRDEPVTAQAPTMGYRMNKFIRRHRGSVASALLVALALIAATVITTFQSIETKRQRDIAVYEQRRVQASNEFTSLLFEEMGTESFTTAELLDRGAKLLDQQYDDQQDFLGRVLYDVAARYGALDERRRQRQLMEQAEVAAREQGDLSLLAAVSCDLAQLLVLTEPERAQSYHRAGLSALENATRPTLTDRIACLRATAKFADVDGRFDDAEQALSEAGELSKTHGSVSVALRATLLTDLAYLYFNNQRNLEALTLLNDIHALYNDNGRGRTRSALKNASNRTVVLSSTGQLLAGKLAFEELIEAYEARDSADRGVGVMLEQYGVTLLRMRQPTLALPALEKARQLAETAGSEVDMAMADLGIARVLVGLNRIPEAEQRLAAAAQLLERNENVYLDQSVYRPLLRAQIHTLASELEQADAIVQRYFDQLGYPESIDGNGLASFLVRAIKIADAREQYELIEKYSTDLLHIGEGFAADPKTSADVGYSLLYRAQAREALGRLSDAQADADVAIEIFQVSLGEDHPVTESTLLFRERLSSTVN